jgi:hypothetical protein
MSESTRGHTIVFKTGKLHELDKASNALNEEGIPFFKETESSSGVRLAMPFQPDMGPGTWYSILVPDQVKEQAKSVLSNLPFEISSDPDIWHFGSSEKQKRWWKIFTWAMLVFAAVFVIGYIINLFYQIV